APPWTGANDLPRRSRLRACEARLDAAVPSQTPSRCHSKERESQKSEPGESLESDHEQPALAARLHDPLAQTTAVQLAFRLQDWVGNSREVRADPLQISQYIQVQGRGCDRFNLALGQPLHVRFGELSLHVADLFLLQHKLARHVDVPGNEDGDGKQTG